MKFATPENTDVINKKNYVQCAAFSGVSRRQSLIRSHIRTKSERELNAENNSVFEAFSALNTGI